jgi:hypothetical protein
MELQQLAEDPSSVGGLFAKWAPSTNGAHDKATRIVGTIAALIFPTVGGLGDANESLYIPYQQRVLSPLRAAAKIPEHFVGNGAWDQVDYDRMPSRCRLLFGESIYAKWDTVRIYASMAISCCMCLWAFISALDPRGILRGIFLMVWNRSRSSDVVNRHALSGLLLDENVLSILG